MSFSFFPLYALGLTLALPFWPVTLMAVASVAWGVNRRRAGRISPGSAPVAFLALLLLPTLLILVASGYWFVQSVDDVHNDLARATILALFGAQIVLSVFVNRRMRDLQESAFFFILPALYVTAVATFLGIWAVGGGASL